MNIDTRISNSNIKIAQYQLVNNLKDTEMASSLYNPYENLCVEPKEEIESLYCDFGLEGKSDLKLDLEQLEENTIDNIDELTYEEISSKIKSNLRKGTKRELSNKIETIDKNRDSVYKGALGSNSITLEDMYSYATNGIRANEVSEEDVNKVIELNGLDSTENNKWAVGKLMGLGIDVTSSSMTKIQNIKDSIDGLVEYENNLKEMEELGLVDNITKIASDDIIMQDDSVIYDEEYVEDIIEDLGKVKVADIKELLDKDKQVTINNLRAVMNENVDKVLKEDTVLQEDLEMDKSVETAIDETIVKNEVTEQNNEVENIKRSINEIRAVLNREAAIKISSKLPLESSELIDVANELMKIQQEEVNQAIDKVEIAKTDENKKLITQTIQAVNTLRVNKEVAAGIELKQNESLSGIEKILATYDSNSLTVEAKFGDGIHKLDNEIKHLLSRYNLEANKENMESVRALIHGNIEVNEHTLKTMRAVIRQINTVTEGGSAEIYAKMIKEGINPYTSSISNLAQFIGKEELEDLKNNVAEAIVMLDKAESINEEQRKSLIGVYRIINSLNKNKEKVVGYMVRNEYSLTLENVAEALDHIHKKNIDVKVDDSFGEVESIILGDNSLKKLIQSFDNYQSKLMEQINIAENTYIDKGKLEGLVGNELYKMAKQLIKESLKEVSNIGQLPESTKEKLEYLKGVSEEVLEFIGKSDIVPTINNIYWIDRLYKEKSLYSELIKDKESKLKDLPKDLEELKEIVQELEETSKENKESSILKGNSQEYREYKQIEEVSRIVNTLREKEGIYNIPFIVNGEAKNVVMYLNKERNRQEIAEKGLKAVIIYNTKTMGEIKATLTIKEDNIDYHLECLDSGKLNANKDELRALLKSIGYTLRNTNNEEGKEGIKTDTRYGNSEIEILV